MDRLLPQNPSPVSTYCSDLELKGLGATQILRRSQRLIDKEHQELTKALTPQCRSPQLFGESEDVYSQLLCQQEEPPSKVVHLKETDKVVHPTGASDKLVHLRAEESNQILHLKSSSKMHTSAKILHLKRHEEVQETAPQKNVEKPSAQITHLKNQMEVKNTCKLLHEAVPQKNLKRKRTTYQQSSQPAAKKRVRAPLNRHEAVKTPLSKKHLSSSSTSSQSKLPPKYPEHFDKQLKNTSYVPLQVNSAPSRVPLQELCPTPEPTPIAASQGETWNKSSPTVDSESSLPISLSDSICEIFGSKDVNDILNIKSPRRYILIEEHLPAVATMLNVDVNRLRNVLEITQRLSHEQILGFPIKTEPSSSLDVLDSN
ncbi:meiotic recombination protein P22 [Drosophila kikkawai]|uniref:Meiotic recombination protein P22 n=1 Tax=Drosophila kikkawai TaxID=30033 RepID=A0A6P4I527_DROKI|nr:meiotic recombination protein P22 [Drosophila kikkawai]